MKKSLQVVFSMIMLGSTLFFAFCKEDEATSTDTDPREKFLGTWVVEESCTRLKYDVNISADATDDARVWLENFADSPPEFPQTYGVVNGYQISIPEQTIGDDWIINGIGTLQQSGKIVWAYFIEIDTIGSDCTAVFEK